MKCLANPIQWIARYGIDSIAGWNKQMNCLANPIQWIARYWIDLITCWNMQMKCLANPIRWIASWRDNQPSPSSQTLNRLSKSASGSASCTTTRVVHSATMLLSASSRMRFFGEDSSIAGIPMARNSRCLLIIIGDYQFYNKLNSWYFPKVRNKSKQHLFALKFMFTSPCETSQILKIVKI